MCHVSDYELQVGMIEALFRLTHQKDRMNMSRVWFTDHVHLQAFQEVKDTDFETVRYLKHGFPL